MSNSKPTVARRTRVERNLYESSRLDPRGRPMTVYEIGYRDSTGTQRWQTVHGGITAARGERDRILGARAQPGARVLPNPRLRFGDAADQWLDGLKSGNTRSTTQASYANSVRSHLAPRWGRHRLDHVTVTHAVELVRELREEGKAESTIATILRAASRVFAYARRHLGWGGQDPIAIMEPGERPRVAQGEHRLYTRAELQQTLAAAKEPFRTVFMLASVTGARKSECLGLVWGEVDLRDCEAASVRFEFQADRRGNRVALKTEGARRIVAIPPVLAEALVALWGRSIVGSDDFVFSTRTGRPLGQRNVLRELRRAMKRATNANGEPTFPVLHRAGTIPRGAVPHFHGFRHTAASEAVSAGDSVEEISWQLGHANSTVTRQIYVHEVKTLERTAASRDRMQARYESILPPAQSTNSPSDVRQPSEGEGTA